MAQTLCRNDSALAIDTSPLIGDDYGKDHMPCWDFGISTVDLPYPTLRVSLFSGISSKESIMPQARSGDTVQVHYTGKLVDGTTFDSSAGGEPLQFTLGEGDLIPGFEQAVLGMAPGENKTHTIPAQQAYGPHQPELLMDVERQEFPDDINPYVGQQLQMTQSNGSTVQVVVTAVNAAHVTLDANHPLAGQDLVFDITLVSIM
jgi:peptidylprolyl isomerase